MKRLPALLPLFLLLLPVAFAQQKPDYPHKGSVTHSPGTVSNPDSYTVFTDNGSETCVFYSNSAGCSSDSADDPLDSFDVWVRLEDGRVKRIGSFCGKDAPKGVAPSDFFYRRGIYAFFPYRIEGEKIYVPRSKDWRVAAVGEKADGETCFEFEKPGGIDDPNAIPVPDLLKVPTQ